MLFVTSMSTSLRFYVFPSTSLRGDLCALSVDNGTREVFVVLVASSNTRESLELLLSSQRRSSVSSANASVIPVRLLASRSLIVLPEIKDKLFSASRRRLKL